MSLIYFHILLMVCGIAFFFGFGVWEAQAYARASQRMDLWMAGASFVFSAALAVYLVWFIRNKKPGMK